MPDAGTPAGPEIGPSSTLYTVRSVRVGPRAANDIAHDSRAIALATDPTRAQRPDLSHDMQQVVLCNIRANRVPNASR